MTGLPAIGGANNLLQTRKAAPPVHNARATGADHVKTPNPAPVKTDPDDKGITNNALSKSSSKVQATLLSLKPSGISSS